LTAQSGPHDALNPRPWRCGRRLTAGTQRPGSSQGPGRSFLGARTHAAQHAAGGRPGIRSGSAPLAAPAGGCPMTLNPALKMRPPA